jgi:multisubunit Na+/H+ antiporter MnhB subunit
MNKTTNLVIFFFVATLFNLILFIVLLFGLYILLSRLMSPDLGFILSSLFAIMLTFILYGWAMKWATKRFSLEKHIPQLFRKKK